MFTLNEIKIVFTTLTKRRAVLKKALVGGDLAEDLVREYNDNIQHLDSAIQKLAKMGAAQQKTAVVAPPKKNKKITRETARILVAEDNEDSANLLIEILTHEIGLKRIDLATDGIQAFDKIKSAMDDPYQLILCDWDMPGLNGLDVYRKAKASNTLNGAHFIMVTAMSEAEKIREAVTEGVSGYVVKPLDIDILEEKVTSVLKSFL